MNTFLFELRRRKVVRVASAYVVTAWLVMQMVNVAVPTLELPGWFDGAVFVSLAAGFPVALLLAWAFELTPEGIRPTVATSKPANTARLATIDLVLLAAVAALIGISLFQIARPRDAGIEVANAPPSAPAEAASVGPESAAHAGPSIAVLPFANLSPEPEQEYFSDGLSEELLNQLANLDGLRVTARTSSFAFKGKNVDARFIGTSLGVDHLLEGSVRKSGDELRINAQLITTSDGAEIWSGSYARRLDDVFAIQEEISAAVARELRVVLEVNSPATAYDGTDDVAAYDHFLRGRAAWNRTGRDAIRTAVDEFTEATRIDPEYGAAWVGLARAAQMLTVFEPDRTAALTATLRMASERAAQVSPDRWEARAISARLFISERNWSAAARALDDAARAGRPPAAERADIEGEFLMQVGRAREALPLFEAARASDPLSSTMSAYAAWLLERTGRSAEALAEFERAEALTGGLEPAWAAHHLWNLLNAGDTAAIRTFVARMPYDDDAYSALLRQVIENWDSPEAGLAAVRTITASAMTDGVQESALALFAAYFGDIELAIDMERDALLVKGGGIPAHLWHPLMAEVRRTVGFKGIVRDLGLVDYWRESGDWSDFCAPLGPSDFECF